MSWIELLRQDFRDESERTDTDYTAPAPRGYAYDLGGGYIQVFSDPALVHHGSTDSKMMRCHLDATGASVWAALQYLGFAGSGRSGIPPTLNYRGNRVRWWNRLETLPTRWTEYWLYWLYHEGTKLDGTWRGYIRNMLTVLGYRSGIGVEVGRMFLNGSLQGAWVPLPELEDMDWHLFEATYIRDEINGLYELKVDGNVKLSQTGNTLEFPLPDEGIGQVYVCRGYEIGPIISGSHTQAPTVLIDEIVTEGMAVSGGRRTRVTANAFTGGRLTRVA